MFSRPLARTVARSAQQAPPRVVRAAPLSTDKINMEPAWRERAAIPDYNGWDATLEESFQKRKQAPVFKPGSENPPLKDGRSGIADSVLDLVGQTPLVRMSRLCAHLGLPEDVEVLAKCEYFSAGGSVKDRVGLRMVREAEKDGRLKKGDVIIEPTSGNTGIGLCMAAAVSGYKVIICMPHKMSSEKANTMKALGAEIIRTPNEAGWKDYNSHIALSADLAGVRCGRLRCLSCCIFHIFPHSPRTPHLRAPRGPGGLTRWMAHQPFARVCGPFVVAVFSSTNPTPPPFPAHSPNAHVLDQYLNAGNPLSHYEGTAEEILRQCDGKLDVILMTAGTGGTITGIGRKIKEVLPHVKVVAVDPVGSLLAVPDHLNDYKRLVGFQVRRVFLFFSFRFGVSVFFPRLASLACDVRCTCVVHAVHAPSPTRTAKLGGRYRVRLHPHGA